MGTYRTPLNFSDVGKIKEALKEDLGFGDVTTRTLILKNQRGEAVIVSKEAGIFCGGRVAREVFRLRDSSLRTEVHVKDGRRVKKGTNVLTIRGRIRSILEAERVALNFLGRLSGIATLTRAYVDKIRGTKAKIYDTRKTTPLWREFEKHAVRCGGGENHRFGLWDEVLVKDNHWAALSQSSKKFSPHPFPLPPWGGEGKVRGGISGALRVLAIMRKRKHVPVEVEVKSLKQLASLLSSPFVPDSILLDNFSVRELRRAVLFVKGLDRVLRTRYKIRRKRPEIEASGGITLANVRAVAQTGVDRISVGRLTHSAPALDFSLRLCVDS